MWGEHGASQRDRGEEVHLEQRPQLVVGRLLDRPHLRAAGVVHEDVDPAEVLDRVIDRADPLVRVGDVQTHRVHPVIGGEIAQLARIPRGRDDAIAAVQSGLGQSAAEAA